MKSVLWNLVFANIRTNKLRAALSMLSIAFGVGLLCALILLQGQVSRGVEQERMNKYGDADLRIGYYSETGNGSSQTLLDPKLIESVKQKSNIQQISQVLEHSQLAAVKNDDFTIQDFTYIGVDNEPLTMSIYRYHKPLHGDEVVITQSVASQYQLKVSSPLIVPMKSGKQLLWKVAEIIPDRTHSGSLSNRMVLIPIQTLQQVLGIDSGVNPIYVKVDDRSSLEQTIAALKKDMLSESQLYIDKIDILHDKRDNTLSFMVMGYIVAGFACLVSILLFLGNMRIAYREKIQELATIRVIGGSGLQIKRLVFYEAVLTGLFGVLLGLLIAIGLANLATGLLAELFHLELPAVRIEWPGMLIAAGVAWSAVALLSLVPAQRASEVEPMLCFREAALDDGERNRRSILIPFIFGTIGLFLVCISSTIQSGEGSRVLLSSLGGVCLTVSIFLSLSIVLNGILPMLGKRADSLTWISFKQIDAESKLSTYAIILFALSLTVFMPVSTLWSSVRAASVQNIDQNTAVDIVATGTTWEFSTLPGSLVQTISEISGVRSAIPVALAKTVQLVDFDVAKADQTWVSQNSDKDNKGVASWEKLWYAVTDLQKLAQAGFIPPPSTPLSSTVILSAEYASNLGVHAGDRFNLKVDGETTAVVIGAIVDMLPSYTGYKRLIFVDASNPLLKSFKPGAVDKILIDADESRLDNVTKELEDLKYGYPDLRWKSKAGDLAELSAGINQRMGMLWAVTLLVLLIGLMGMFSTISASNLANMREYAILRTIHVSPMQLVALILIKSTVYAVLAILLGGVTGFTLSFAFINGLDDGAMVIPWGQEAVISLLILVCTVLVTLPMAIRLAKRPLAQALENE